MTSFHIDDMTCGHCVATITRAVQAQHPQARVQADLAGRLVHIDGTAAGAPALAALITDAGYTPVPVQVPAIPATDPRAGARTGCGCGAGGGCRA